MGPVRDDRAGHIVRRVGGVVAAASGGGRAALFGDVAVDAVQRRGWGRQVQSMVLLQRICL